MRMNWPNLTWRKASWPAKTYHAKSGVHSYAVDHDGAGWCLRVWDGGKLVVYRHGGSTAAQMQQLADDHAAKS
jgi:hypothetical protein